MRFWILLLLAMSISSEALSNTQIRLRPESTVTGSQITLGEIAQITAEDEASLAKLSQVAVGSAPAPGRRVALHPGIIMAKLKTAGIDVRSFDFQAPERIVVESESQCVSSERLVEAALGFVRSHYPAAELDPDLEVTAPVNPFYTFPGQIELVSHSFMAIPMHGRSTVTVAVLLGGKKIHSVQIPVNIRLRQQVWVAKHRIPRRTPLQDSDFQQEQRDAGSFVGKPIGFDDGSVDLRARRDIPNGAILTTQLAEVTPLVERGQLILTELVFKGIRLRFAGKALSSAQKGDMIPLMNPSTGKRLDALIVSSGLARIQMD